MIASEARIAANRANALKSTGPKTAEGKEASRGNAYKHGMTGAGVVVRDDADAVGRRAAGMLDHYRPETDEGLALVRRAAVLSVRLERCSAHEAAAIARDVRKAGDDFDEARLAEVDRLWALLPDDPAAATRQLRRLPEGVDRMIAGWLDLRSDLGHGEAVRWSAEHEQLAENLTGRRPEGFGTSRVRVVSRAIRGDFDLLGPVEGPAGDPAARSRWARARMVELIDAEVAKLRAHRETLDHDGLEALRALAPDLALFDPSKEATLARRYEATAERMMYRALREMRRVEAENRARPEPERPSPVVAEVHRLASFFLATSSEAPQASGPPSVAPSVPAPGAPATRFELAGPTDGVPIPAGKRV